ncbi:hypothetical protein V6N13_080494 [Hibiscus sabdariffa]
MMTSTISLGSYKLLNSLTNDSTINGLTFGSKSTAEEVTNTCPDLHSITAIITVRRRGSERRRLEFWRSDERETMPGSLRMNMQSLRMESDDDIAPCGVGATATGCELTIAIEEEAGKLFGSHYI